MSLFSSLPSSFHTLVSCSLLLSVTGCQLVQLKEKTLSSSLSSKTDHILTAKHLSDVSLDLLRMNGLKEYSCLEEVNVCVSTLSSNKMSDDASLYGTVSEIYLAKAMETQHSQKCKSAFSHQAESAHKKTCLNEHLHFLNKSLRYSYAYLFKTDQPPASRIFDLRQGQIRTFYNFALSQLITSAYLRDQYTQIPAQFMADQTVYQFSTKQYPLLQQTSLQQLMSSYNLNFSGFYGMNRQEGLGAEFVAVTPKPEQQIISQFIVDPERYFSVLSNPNIHHARYLPVSAVAQPVTPSESTESILQNAAFEISLIDPYSHKTATINGTDYTLTANYSVPYALWLADSRLGFAGYKTLLNRENRLAMPHLFMIEPYQPNKKIIILIHGLASSPETWIPLTNNIMGDSELRDHYQIWQIFYSTNIPIFENRFQINSLIQQAFKEVEPNTSSAQDAVLIGHSMGGIISRLLVSNADISLHAIPLMNYEQHIQMQQNPVIRERFIFKALPQVSRAVFIASPHRGSDYANQWHTEILKKLITLPQNFSESVQTKGIKNSTQGLIFNAPSDLSDQSRFIQLTSDILPSPSVSYHSIIGNKTGSQDSAKMNDGIVPYKSSHLAGAKSELVIKGGHSIHESPAAIMELRRILKEHLASR